MYQNFVSKIHLSLLRLFFPQTCLFCETGREICCSKCFASISQNVNFENNILSLYYYSNPKINKLIWQLKYHHSGDIAKLFSSIMAEKLEKVFFPIFPPNTQNIYLIPIPLNQDDKRLHNHAELLANEIYNILSGSPSKGRDSVQEHFSPNIVVLNNLLIKNSKQKQSHTKSRQERLENVKNSFSVNPRFVPTRQNASHFAAPLPTHQNSIYILVDDVTTSNSTINEARKTISQHLQIPDTTIFAVTIAH